MELRQYLALIRKWMWLVLLAVSMAALSSYLASRAATPLYSTKTTLMVGRIMQNPDPSSTEINTGQQLARTYMELVRHEPVLRGTILSLGIDMQWEALRGRVRASVVPQTQLLEITVIDNDPYRAKLLADTLAEQLILQSPTMPNNMTQEQLAFTQNQIDDLKNKIETSQQQIERLQQELDAANSSRTIQELENQIAILDTKIGNWQNTYSQLLVSLQGGEVNALAVIEEAILPQTPFSPDIQNNVLLASAVGLLLAVGGIFIIEYMDDTIKTPEDITRVTNLTTMGSIGRIMGQTPPEKLIAARQPLSPTAEAYRVLRANLQFSSLDRTINTLMVTSPLPREGKSITAANLAVVLAQSGLRVILVDTDYRRPTIHKIFELSNRNGLTHVILFPQTPLDKYLKETSITNLRVLTSGPPPPNPSELLASARMKELVRVVEAEADFVIFDSPPVLPFADAAILGNHVDGVLMVNYAGSTRTTEAKKAVESLQRVKVNLLGVVLNNASVVGTQYRYYLNPDDQDDNRQNGHRGALRGIKLRIGGQQTRPESTEE